VGTLRWYTQARMFYLVKNPELKKAVASACFDQDHVELAPVIVVACTDVEAMRALYGKRGTTLYGICDVSAAVENLLLAAWSEGWVAAGWGILTNKNFKGFEDT